MKTQYEDVKILKSEDLRKLLGIGRDKANALMSCETFPSTKIGRSYFVTEKNLYSWLENYAGKEFEL